VPQAIRNFLRQTYTNLELLIVDDGTDAVGDCVPDDRRIRYLRPGQKLNTGAKRNYACGQAAGEFIVHWDDDDWYPDWRVRAQVNALLKEGADLCGSSRVSYYEPATDRAWEYKYTGPGKAWVAGNTLAYRKSFWERNGFPEIQVGEDSRFVWSRADKTVRDMDDASLCVAMIHEGNTSRKVTRGSFWHPRPASLIHEMLCDERYFYYAAPKDSTPDEVPLISCIMPTYNRRRHLTLALEMFRAQDYPRLELVMVDDGSDPVHDLVCDQSNVRYLRLESRASIGTKRNLACMHASGSIIAHWDDDDWYAPDRLRYQAAPILSGEADLTGLESSFVLDLPSGQFWTAQPHIHRRMFVGNVHGGTLVYRRELLAEGVRYPETNLAEDAAFLSRATKLGKRLLRLSNPGIFVYVRHGQNAWKEFKPGRFISPAGWEHITPPPTFHPQLLDSYRHATT
jgi:glycosyltransferase involved in cell wall biosynthesis